MDEWDMLLQGLSLDSSGLSLQMMSLGAIFNLLLAGLFGFLILLVYLKTSGKETRDRNLFTVIPVLTILMTVIMKVDGAQIVLFFGIFGVLSIVRFRSDLTDQKGITFILFSVIIGVLVGAGNYFLALLAFLVVTLAIILARYTFRTRHRYKIIVKTQAPALAAKAFMETWLKDQGLDFRLVSFSSECTTNKQSEWEDKTRFEFELRLTQKGNLLENWVAFLPSLREQKIEAELKPGVMD